MHEVLILKLLILVAVANGTPLLAKLALGDAVARPIDGGVRFIDGRPLLGASKTLRGVVLSLLATSAVAAGLGLGVAFGAVIGALAMMGDLLSSFVKRRLGLAPSSMAIGLDQIPESLLPLLGALLFLPLTVLDIAVVVLLFAAGELLLSPVLFKLKLRDRPY